MGHGAQPGPCGTSRRSALCFVRQRVTLGYPMLKTFPGSIGSRVKLPAILHPDPNAPQPVRQAVLWMYAGAGVSTITLILTVISAFTLIGLKNSLMVQYAQQLKDNKVTVSQINTFVSQLDQQTIEGIVIGVVM